MKIQTLLENDEIRPSRLPDTLWYHCGPDFEQFSTAFLGSGENNHLLGHGLYLINSPEVAKRYAKHVKSGKPFLYEVQLQNVNSDNFYCGRNKPSPRQVDGFNAIAKLLGYDNYQSVKYRHSNMKYGRGLVGAVFERFGSQKGAQILNEHDLYGQFEDLGYDNLFEIAVWNVDVLHIVNKEKLPETEQVTVEVDPDLDAWWEEFMNGTPDEKKAP